MIVNFVAAMRRRSAFMLCREYGISAAEIAPVLGLNEQQFLRALEREGLSHTEMQHGNRQLRLAQRIMDLLRKELDTLSSLDEEASGKVRLDGSGPRFGVRPKRLSGTKNERKLNQLPGCKNTPATRDVAKRFSAYLYTPEGHPGDFCERKLSHIVRLRVC